MATQRNSVGASNGRDVSRTQGKEGSGSWALVGHLHAEVSGQNLVIGLLATVGRGHAVLGLDGQQTPEEQENLDSKRKAEWLGRGRGQCLSLCVIKLPENGHCITPVSKIKGWVFQTMNQCSQLF